VGEAPTLPAGQLHSLFAHEALGRCRSCGYDIHSLAPDAACPECATPVDVSRDSYLLADADPVWLGRMALGLSIIRWGSLFVKVTIYAVAFTLLATSFASGNVFALLTGSTVRPSPNWAPMSCQVLFKAIPVAFVVVMIGFSFAADRDPRDALRREPPWPRRALRPLAALAALTWAAVAARMIPAPGITAQLFLAPATLGAFLLLPPALLAVAEYLRSIAERIPAPKWAASARRAGRWCVWLLPLPVMGWVALLAVPMFSPGTFVRIPAFGTLVVILSVIAMLPISRLGVLSIDIANAVHQIRRDVVGSRPTATERRIVPPVAAAPAVAALGATGMPRGDARV